MFGLGVREFVTLGFLGLALTSGGALFIVVPAVAAYRRGYNPVAWGLAGVFANNPLFVLVLLAMVPHRARLRLRERFTAELDEKLAGIGAGPAEDAGGAARADTFTVGDEATRLPHRSIGDDLTRM
jgi:hypothetical protein